MFSSERVGNRVCLDEIACSEDCDVLKLFLFLLMVRRFGRELRDKSYAAIRAPYEALAIFSLAFWAEHFRPPNGPGAHPRGARTCQRSSGTARAATNDSRGRSELHGP